MEDGADQDLDVAVVEAGDGISEDDRGMAGDAGGRTGAFSVRRLSWGLALR